jgi:hypothetical protein
MTVGSRVAGNTVKQAGAIVAQTCRHGNAAMLHASDRAGLSSREQCPSPAWGVWLIEEGTHYRGLPEATGLVERLHFSVRIGVDRVQ